MTVQPTSSSPGRPAPGPAVGPTAGPAAGAAGSGVQHVAGPAAASPDSPAPDLADTFRGARPWPVLLLRSWAWGWLSVVQLTTGLLLAGLYIAFAALILSAIFSVAAFGFGMVMLAVLLPLARVLGELERLRVEAFIGVRVDPPPGPPPGTPWWRRLFLDGRSWRAVVQLTIGGFWGLIVGGVTAVLLSLSVVVVGLPFYRLLLPPGPMRLIGDVSVPVGAVGFSLGLAMLLLLPLVARGLTGVDLALAQSLLGPGRREQVERLTERVETLTQSREMTVDSVEAERRRIERDLHDGPQQRLVAIAMDLGMAQAKLQGDPDAAKDLLGKAHTAAKEAIVEMRQVARGIHPPVLTDRGLDAALSALAARSPVPVHVHVDLAGRPTPTIEAIAYFCVSEALTNVAKHSGARGARVEVVRANGGLRVQVSDDGRGGADATRGTGLIGLRQRLAAVDGTLHVESPPGLGTRLIMTLPERSAADRTDDRPTTPRSPA